MKKTIYRALSMVICVIILTVSSVVTTVLASSEEQIIPYTLSVGNDLFTFDGWGMYPSTPPQNDFIKNKIYKELGINTIRVGLYSECDENDKLVTSNSEFHEFITLVKHAKEFNLDYMISIWSPPASMKSNGRVDNSPEGYLRKDKEQAFCDYVVQVFDYLKENSLPLPIAFGFANEPNHEHVYASCDYYDGQLERVLKLFNTTFEESGYGDILICTPEESSYSENYKTFSNSWFYKNNALLQDEAYKNAYDVLAFHGYAWEASDSLSPIVKRSDSFMSGKEIWSTETGEDASVPGSYDGLGKLLRKVNFHTQIYEANRWIYWRAYDNTDGYSYSLAVSDDTGSLKTMATYYFIKALFNNVPAGSKVVRINTNDPAYNTQPSVAVRNTDLLDIGGFRTENGQVFTIYNSTNVEKYYNLSGLTGDSILIYRFDDDGNIAHEKVSNSGSAYNGLCVNPGDSIIFVTGNNLSFGDDPEIGADNEEKVIVENFITEVSPETDASNKSIVGTVWKADGTVEEWKTSRPNYFGVRRDEAGFNDEYIVLKGQSDSSFAYTSGGPTLYSDKNWSIRVTCDLSQCSWKNVQGSKDTYVTMLATTYQPFNVPSSDNNQNAFEVIITQSGMIRISGGQTGSYFVYMADESKINASNFDPSGIHTYTINKNGADIELAIDGIELGKLKKMAHISNADIGYTDSRAIDIPATWGNVTVVDSKGDSRTHKADLDLSAYSPLLKYIGVSSKIYIDEISYNGSWQTSNYPGIKNLEIIEDTNNREFPTFSGFSANIGDEYSLLFNVDKSIIASEEVDSYTVRITNGRTLETYEVEKIAPVSYKRGYDSYAFRNINPSKLDDKITGMITVNYKDGYSSSCTFTYSMKRYCYDKLKSFAMKGNLTEEEQKQKKAIIDMLNYGAAVQKYTNESLSLHELVDYGLSTEDKNISSPTVVDMKEVIDDVNDPVVTWESVKALFSNSVKLRFYVDVPTGIDVNSIKAVVELEGSEPYEIPGTDFIVENGEYSFETKNIGFLSLGKPIRVQMKSGDSALSRTLIYSVESYASYHKEQEESNSFNRVVDTMINFGNSILEYDAVSAK